MITGLASLAALAATVAVSATQAGRFGLLVDGVGALAVILLFLALVLRWARLVPWALLTAGAAYLVGREGTHVVDPKAAAVGAVLLLASELATWSLEHDPRIASERSLVVRRVVTLGGLVTAALLVDFVLLGAAGVKAGSGLTLAAIGVAASVAAIAVVLRLVRSAN